SGDLRLAAKPPHVLFPSDLSDVVFDRVARDYRLAEFRFFDREEIDLLWMVAAHLRQHADRTRPLRHSLDQQYAGKDLIAGEVPEELGLIDSDVLESNGGFVTLHVDDAIDHQKRIAMR